MNEFGQYLSIKPYLATLVDYCTVSGSLPGYRLYLPASPTGYQVF